MSRYNTPRGRHRFASIWTTVRSFDIRTWVVILMMVLVLTVMMALNAQAWATFLPVWIAYALSIFMEVGALAWKFANERPDNSDDQQKLTDFLVWMNIILATILMIINLVRNALHNGLEVTGVTGWDYAAFAMVAGSAFGHIAGALLFRQWDEGLQNKRTIAKQYSQAKFDKARAEGILEDTQNRLEIRSKIASKLSELRQQYKDLPANELEALLKDAQDALEIEFSFDYDGDNTIGGIPISVVITSQERIEIQRLAKAGWTIQQIEGRLRKDLTGNGMIGETPNAPSWADQAPMPLQSDTPDFTNPSQPNDHRRNA